MYSFSGVKKNVFVWRRVVNFLYVFTYRGIFVVYEYFVLMEIISVIYASLLCFVIAYDSYSTVEWK
jgi:hypothetical protein